MSLSKENVKYICEVDEDFGTEKYFKQVFLTELEMWGAKRTVTKKTFSKRKNEGCKVEYWKSEIDMNLIKEQIINTKSMIDLSLDSKDETWFYQLTRQLNLLKRIMQ